MDLDLDVLRDAADDHRDATDDLDKDWALDDIKPESVGHVELNDWLLAVVDQCQNAERALDVAGESLGDTLDDVADLMEETDWVSGARFVSIYTENYAEEAS